MEFSNQERILLREIQADASLSLADLSGRIRAATDRLFELSVMDVETRVRHYLVRTLIEAGQLQDGGVLDPAPSHGLIAAHVGANREAVSRSVAVFRRAGPRRSSARSSDPISRAIGTS